MPSEPENPRPAAGFDALRARADFPALAERARERPLVYLDNAATTQLPEVVIEAVARYARHGRGNVHRGVHFLSERSSAAYDAARTGVQHWLNAAEAREVIFVRGATEAINLVAHAFAVREVGEGDEILVTALEHHANLVPWQVLCQRVGARLRVAPITDSGELRLDALADAIGARTRLVAVAHASNAIGTINPIASVVELAHARGVPVLVDGAQAAAHLPCDVRAIGCDFYALSGHKLYAPTGIGVLYARSEWLERLPPFQTGGDMVRSVSFEAARYADAPRKFEAGTPNVEGAVGLAAALDYLRGLGLEALRAHEAELTRYLLERLERVPGLRLVGTAQKRCPIASFVLDRAHAHDLGTVLDQHGIAVRAGHHCAQPLLTRLGVPATLRASLALYNTREDVDALAQGLERAREIFG